LTAGAMVTIVLMATIAAFGGAGGPGRSLVTTLIVLDAIRLGPRAGAGMALVAAVGRPLAICRPAVKTMSKHLGAGWVPATERVAGAAGALVETRPVAESSATL